MLSKIRELASQAEETPPLATKRDKNERYHSGTAEAAVAMAPIIMEINQYAEVLATNDPEGLGRIFSQLRSQLLLMCLTRTGISAPTMPGDAPSPITTQLPFDRSIHKNFDFAKLSWEEYITRFSIKVLGTDVRFVKSDAYASIPHSDYPSVDRLENYNLDTMLTGRSILNIASALYANSFSAPYLTTPHIPLQTAFIFVSDIQYALLEIAQRPNRFASVIEKKKLTSALKNVDEYIRENKEKALFDTWNSPSELVGMIRMGDTLDKMLSGYKRLFTETPSLEFQEQLLELYLNQVFAHLPVSEQKDAWKSRVAAHSDQLTYANWFALLGAFGSLGEAKQLHIFVDANLDQRDLIPLDMYKAISENGEFHHGGCPASFFRNGDIINNMFAAHYSMMLKTAQLIIENTNYFNHIYISRPAMRKIDTFCRLVVEHNNFLGIQISHETLNSTSLQTDHTIADHFYEVPEKFSPLVLTHYQEIPTDEEYVHTSHDQKHRERDICLIQTLASQVKDEVGAPSSDHNELWQFFFNQLYDPKPPL